MSPRRASIPTPKIPAPDQITDPLLTNIVNRARWLAQGQMGRPEAYRPARVMVDTLLDQSGRDYAFDAGSNEVQVSARMSDALKLPFLGPQVGWTGIDQPLAIRSAQSLGTLQTLALREASGYTAPATTPEAHFARMATIEALGVGTRNEYLKEMGVTDRAPDIAAIKSVAHPMGAGQVRVLGDYLAQQTGRSQTEVLSQLAAADDQRRAVAELALQGYKPELLAHVQGLPQDQQDRIMSRVADAASAVYQPGKQRAAGHVELADGSRRDPQSRALEAARRESPHTPVLAFGPMRFRPPSGGHGEAVLNGARAAANLHSVVVDVAAEAKVRKDPSISVAHEKLSGELRIAKVAEAHTFGSRHLEAVGWTAGVRTKAAGNWISEAGGKLVSGTVGLLNAAGEHVGHIRQPDSRTREHVEQQQGLGW